MKAINTFEKFNQEFFVHAPIKISWYDREGLFDVGQDRIAFLQLEESNTKDKYDGYRVKIVNKHSGGVITSKYFSFKLHIQNWYRLDGNNYYYAWYDRDQLEWYNSKPVDTRQMIAIIFDYINKFK